MMMMMMMIIIIIIAEAGARGGVVGCTMLRTSRKIAGWIPDEIIGFFN
jgi:hypothetical protein